MGRQPDAQEPESCSIFTPVYARSRFAMAEELKDKVKLALDEARMLILGAQILLGFEFRTFLEPGLDTLPRPWHYVKLLGLVLILVTNCLLMWPATFQQLCERGEATEPVDRFANRIMCCALLPFAAAMGIDVAVTFGKFGGPGLGITGGAVATGIALFFWYVLGAWHRVARDRSHGRGNADQAKSPAPDAQAPEAKRRRAVFETSNRDGNGGGPGGQQREHDKGAGDGGTPLKDKINDVLTEGRVILPGAQAVLGFQLIVMLSPGFDKLPRGSQYVHLASLTLIALSTILLMTAPAYHRIVEHGELTPHFFRFSSRLLLAAMVPLAAGMAGDFFVVARKVMHSVAWSAAASAALLAVFYGAWFGYTLYRRLKNTKNAKKAKDATAEPSRPPRRLAEAI